jgi:hypothetical protein
LICATGFQGGLGTQVVKVFDRVAARTGLRDLEAIEAGFDPLTVSLTSWDHKVYYPGAKELHIRLTGDRCNGRLLGAQLVGHRKSEVSKRVDIFATALFHGMCVAELCDLDLSYTPPLSSPWNPVQRNKTPVAAGSRPLDILKACYARGDITEEEFQGIREGLQQFY